MAHSEPVDISVVYIELQSSLLHRPDLKRYSRWHALCHPRYDLQRFFPLGASGQDGWTGLFGWEKKQRVQDKMQEPFSPSYITQPMILCYNWLFHYLWWHNNQRGFDRGAEPLADEQRASAVCTYITSRCITVVSQFCLKQFLLCSAGGGAKE